jgi:hypothetical protein
MTGTASSSGSNCDASDAAILGPLTDGVVGVTGSAAGSHTNSSGTQRIYVLPTERSMDSYPYPKYKLDSIVDNVSEK